MAKSALNLYAAVMLFISSANAADSFLNLDSGTVKPSAYEWKQIAFGIIALAVAFSVTNLRKKQISKSPDIQKRMSDFQMLPWYKRWWLIGSGRAFFPKREPTEDNDPHKRKGA